MEQTHSSKEDIVPDPHMGDVPDSSIYPASTDPSSVYVYGTQPPSYLEAQGVEVEIQDSGIDAQALPTIDGRVDINIHLAQPGLFERLLAKLNPRPLSVSDEPPGYTPGNVIELPESPPPPLNIVIQVVGSRGDVQPFIALGKVLREKYGHRVRLATHPTFKDFVEEHGLEFFSIGGDPAELMAYMVKNPGMKPGFESLRKGDVGKRRKGMFDIIEGCWQSCIEPFEGHFEAYSSSDSKNSFDERRHGTSFVADAIIANPPSYAHIHCAERLGIPLHLMFTMPWSPTRAFPHPLANLRSENSDKNDFLFSYLMVDMLTWQGLGDIINRFRKKTLGLEPVSLISAATLAIRLKIPFTYCWSPAFIPKPNDWGSHISIAGFYFLSLQSSYTPDPKLEAFLKAGPPPVYIGFGSIVVDDPQAMTDLIFSAVKKSGVRALVSKGWGGLGADELDIPDSIFMLGNVPHDWLFKHVSCVVHHGGAGTTAAGIANGRPTVIVPFFGDQLYWGTMIYERGAGAAPIPYRELTADKLATAITTALSPAVLEKALEFKAEIEKERGTEAGARSFHDKLPEEDITCSILPHRTAVWMIQTKKSQIRLSALAATILINSEVISREDLELFRPVTWATEPGPHDPITGIAIATLDMVTGVVKGLTDYPLEALRAAGLHQQANKKPSTAIDFALDPDRGVSRIVGAGLKAPMSVTHGVTRGFHNAPKLFGDDSVRKEPKITGIGSGLQAAGKQFGYGFYDGITGLVTQPYTGARKEGVAGFWKGVMKGVVGVGLKPAAGLSGMVSYPLKGVHEQFQKAVSPVLGNYLCDARMAQGVEEWEALAQVEQEYMAREAIERWGVLKMGKGERRLEKEGSRSGR